MPEARGQEIRPPVVPQNPKLLVIIVIRLVVVVRPIVRRKEVAVF